MIFLYGGTFEMGCTSEQNNCFGDEKPVHTVVLPDFYIGKFQVTQKLWHVVMGRSIRMQLYLVNSKSLNGEGSEYPMYYVNYSECEEFCSTLNQLLSKQLPKGYKFTLPTEAQWEFAARGGNKSTRNMYFGGNSIDEVAWYEENSNGRAHLVGKKDKNELGIYDMSGNVMEWCRDWYYDFYYENSPSENPKGPDKGTGRVLRGGGWNSKSQHCRVSFRHCTSPSNRSYDVGFRLALVK
jgi:formylglycine-generating enzyme required for sulfatase activity